MGYDAAKWLRTHVEQAEKAADYTQAKVDTDLTAYESDLESNRRAFQDIQAEAAAITQVLQGKRADRLKNRPFREGNRKDHFQSTLGGKHHE